MKRAVYVSQGDISTSLFGQGTDAAGGRASWRPRAQPRRPPRIGRRPWRPCSGVPCSRHSSCMQLHPTMPLPLPLSKVLQLQCCSSQMHDRSYTFCMPSEAAVSFSGSSASSQARKDESFVLEVLKLLKGLGCMLFIHHSHVCQQVSCARSERERQHS